MKANELLRRLRKLGAEVITGRGKGGHVLVKLGEHQTVVPTGTRELPTGTVAAVCKQLGLRPEEL